MSNFSMPEPCLLSEEAYPGVIRIAVDASDTRHRIFRVYETIPVQPGSLRLLYPQWIPGYHNPSGPIDKLAGLVVSAHGQRLPWKRNDHEVYAFHLTVPDGVSEIVVEFQFLSPLNPTQGRMMMTPDLLNLQWNTVSLYPAGYRVGDILMAPSVKFPEGWKYATALRTGACSGEWVEFETVAFEHLIDSPVFAGRHYRRFELDPDLEAPVYLNVFADEDKYLEADEEHLQFHRELVRQAHRLYGSRHYDRYEFLLALSDKLGNIGLEHHRSSENSQPSGYFVEWDKHWGHRDLLPHEFNHSWNGKYRRGADLVAADFNTPVGGSLLWVYEGQTQLYGYLLSARSGLWSEVQVRDQLAVVAAIYDRGRPGMRWRSLLDTTHDPTTAARRPLPFRNYQMSEDYYNGGQLVWLEVHSLLDELSGGRCSIDDFASAFFGMDDGKWQVNPYTFDDVVETLNQLAAFEWAEFFRERIEGHGSLIGGIEACGWWLHYVEQASAAFQVGETRRKVIDLSYSLGMTLNRRGDLTDVLWDGPAFNTGLAPGMSVVAVAGREFREERLKDAISEARATRVPIELLIRDFDRYGMVRIEYYGGLRYPVLKRIEDKPDRLSPLFRAR